MKLEMIYDLVCNKEINVEKDYVSVGGYSVRIGGRDIDFDFDSYSYDVLESDHRYLHVECSSLDVNTFPDAADLTEDMLNNIELFSEFYLESDNEIIPVRLEGLIFVLPDDGYRRIGVPRSVLDKTVFGYPGM